VISLGFSCVTPLTLHLVLGSASQNDTFRLTSVPTTASTSMMDGYGKNEEDIDTTFALQLTFKLIQILYTFYITSANRRVYSR